MKSFPSSCSCMLFICVVYMLLCILYSPCEGFILLLAVAFGNLWFLISLSLLVSIEAYVCHSGSYVCLETGMKPLERLPPSFGSLTDLQVCGNVERSGVFLTSQ